MMQNKLTFTLLLKPEKANGAVPIVSSFAFFPEESMSAVEGERAQGKHVFSFMRGFYVSVPCQATQGYLINIRDKKELQVMHCIGLLRIWRPQEIP